MSDRGVIYVAFGEAARREAEMSIRSLRTCGNAMPVAVACDGPLRHVGPVARVPFGDPGPGARWAKLNADLLAPQAWHSFLYIDADTRVRGDLSAGFAVLADGWDVALAASDHQGGELLWHVSEEERRVTAREWGHVPLQLQCGVMFVRRNEATACLFAAWREEWRRWGDQDQGAFLRALRRVPVRVWLLGKAWNGGAVVAHLFGRLRA